MRKIIIAYVDGYKEEISEEHLAEGATVELLTEGMKSFARTMNFSEIKKGVIHNRIININNVVRFEVYNE